MYELVVMIRNSLKLIDKLIDNTREMRARNLLIQRISIPIQRGNAASTLSTMPNILHQDEISIICLQIQVVTIQNSIDNEAETFLDRMA